MNPNELQPSLWIAVESWHRYLWYQSHEPRVGARQRISRHVRRPVWYRLSAP